MKILSDGEQMFKFDLMSIIQHIFSSVLFRFRWYFLGGKKKAKEFARQRAENQKHCYDFPSENNGWKKVSSDPVYGNKKTGNMFDPFCFVFNDNIYMVVSARNKNTIELLCSKDGLKWNLETTLLKAVPKSWEQVVNRACLIAVDGTWHLFYTGQNGKNSAIGHLTSSDMKSFVRPTVNNPVLIPTLVEEGESVMNPCVLWNNDKHIFQMWYSAGEQYEPDVIFYAESKDGNNWVKSEKPVLEKYTKHEWEIAKVGGCEVHREDDGSYVMYYIGYQNLDVARICYAVSQDGYNWTRPESNLLIAPSKGAFDSDATYKPSIVDYKGQQMMWYNGRKKHDEFIGCAQKCKEIKQ